MDDYSLVRHIVAGLIAFFLGVFLVTTFETIRANSATVETPRVMPYNPGIGDAWGNENGPPADVYCPRSPSDESPLWSERMHRPEPKWGHDGPVAKGYWGDTEISTEPNMKLCEWNAEHLNKHDIMQDRCWPLWHGKRNGASDKKHTCRPA